MEPTPSKKGIRNFFEIFNRILANQYAEMIFLAVLVGSLAGFGGFCLRKMIRFVSILALEGASLSEISTHFPWYVIVFAPACGGLLVGYLAIYAKEVRGHAVSTVIENMVVHGGRIRKRLIFTGSLASALTIGTGGSVGKEGPTVLIGSAIGASVSRLLKVSRERSKTLIGCGAAAGIAGVFNAPIGGAMFALEVILGDFAITTFSPIVIAAVAGTVVSRALVGDHHELMVPQYDLVHFGELFFYGILGLLVGLIAIIFIKVLFKFELWAEKIPLKGKFSPILPMLGGLCVGIVGWGFPEILGPFTYETINLALAGKIIFSTAILLAFIKILATALTLGSGGSGGVFAPSLFIGALFGNGFGNIVHRFFPGFTAEAGAYSLVGMAALVAATTQAPLTAILILFELTDNYTIILPLMLACIISTILVKQVNKESIYTEGLARKGINVRAGRNVNVLKELTVADAMHTEVSTLKETTTFKELLDLLPETRHITSFPVVNKAGELSGILSISDFQSAFFEEGLEDLVIVKELATREVITVFPDDSLQDALTRLSSKDVAHVPVVDPQNQRKIVGILSRRDIINAYNKALLKYNF